MPEIDIDMPRASHNVRSYPTSARPTKSRRIRRLGLPTLESLPGRYNSNPILAGRSLKVVGRGKRQRHEITFERPSPLPVCPACNNGSVTACHLHSPLLACVIFHLQLLTPSLQPYSQRPDTSAPLLSQAPTASACPAQAISCFISAFWSGVGLSHMYHAPPTTPITAASVINAWVSLSLPREKAHWYCCCSRIWRGRGCRAPVRRAALPGWEMSRAAAVRWAGRRAALLRWAWVESRSAAQQRDET